MSDQKDEIERIRRIRERQLALRDPGAAERKRQQRFVARYEREKVTVGSVLSDVPPKWWGMILGGLLGFLLALVLDKVLAIKLVDVSAFWVEYVWYTLILIGIVVGRAFAMTLTWRDEDYDLLVRRR